MVPAIYFHKCAGLGRSRLVMNNLMNSSACGVKHSNFIKVYYVKWRCSMQTIILNIWLLFF